jgi:hypothetical protein
MRAFTALRLFVTAALLSVSAILGAQAQQVVSRVTERIDSSNMATLHSGVHPLARAEFDRGEVSGDTRTDRVQLILARSSTQENALRTLLEQQQDASSLAYHQWLTPTAFGSAYGHRMQTSPRSRRGLQRRVSVQSTSITDERW